MKASGVMPARVSKSRAAASLRWRFLRWSLATNWSRTRRALLVARHLHELARELREGDGRVDHHRLHLGQVLQGFVDVDRVEDAEGLLADLVAQARRAAEHLLEEDAAVDPAQEHEVADLGHVDAGGQQVDGDRDVRIALVLVAADQLQRLVGGAGDLDDGIVVDAAVVLLEGLLEQVARPGRRGRR